jgi:hypothetical protein
VLTPPIGRQIMESSPLEMSRIDFPGDFTHNDLALDRVALLFSAVVLSLSFLGRSIAISVTSMSKVSSTSLTRERFPGS